MMKVRNEEHIEGRVFQHSLEKKTVENKNSANYGKEYIAGTVDVATDEAGLNVIQVHYTFVTPKTKAGKNNATYNVLQQIMDGPTILSDGKENALKVALDPSLALNDFYDKDDNLVSLKINEGGFASIVTTLNDEKLRNTFKMDMVITNVVHVEKDEERHIDEDYTSLRGCVFNFRKDILPVEFKVKNPDAMKWFEALSIDNTHPYFTQLWGKIVSSTTTEPLIEESAFGGEEAAAVRISTKKVRDWVITGAAKVPYDFGDEAVLTEAELSTAMQNRNTYLAEEKARKEEYMASKNNATASAPAVAAPSVGGWTF